MAPHTRCPADALIHVPRHPFIPAQAWAKPAGTGAGHWIDREADPATWWRAVCSDTVVFTQLDDGRTELTPENAAKTYAPTCSASSPLLVNAFLRHLAPRSGDRVLEVGTGTGWTAGLLSYLTGGPEQVVSVDIDAGLSAAAAANLRSAGLAPRLVAGEGEAGVPGLAPFDRTHVTCGVREIPYTWVEQTRPGGVIVMPYAPVMRLLRLKVRDDGTAVGRFHEECAFMVLRGQRSRPARGDVHADAPPRVRKLNRDPATLLHPPPGLQVLFDTVVGDTPWGTEDGVITPLGDGLSRATVRGDQVTQTGPRDLWDTAERIYDAWLGLGRPGLERMGVTVTPEEQFVWLDDPAVPLSYTWK
ncbi:protein-L-isoaspartate O-methyltransferase [Streptomyces sp. NPDC101062]|uniref:protein-L-isoaspartate O-methyltransferase family protein n=1 Tax=unclassified Streptomyces TaxID=2593676 RepID=UPI00380541A0